MKKIIALVLALMLALSMTACVDEVSQSAQSMIDGVASNLDKADDGEDLTWEEFLEEYEKWADKYIAAIKKHQENPSDLTILNEYTKLVGEFTTWTFKAGEVIKDLAGSEDLEKCKKEIERIADKIAKAAEEK